MSESTVQTAALEPDEEIVRLLLDRDPRGLRMLIDVHVPRVKGLLLREFRDSVGEHGIEDAVAEGLHRAWRAIDGYDKKLSPLRAWLYVICRNCARKIRLREHRGPRPGGVADWDALPAATPAAAVDEAATGDSGADAPVETAASPWLAALRACMGALPRLMRAVVDADLRHPDGNAPADQLAESTGSSRGSVYNARSRARTRLRDCLQGKGFDFAGGSTGPADGGAE